MATYNVTITNGSGSQSMQAGTYNVSGTIAGYDASTLTPTTYTATTTEGTGTFTVSATGTLTFNVNETGAAGGTPVTGGTMIMTDSTGATEYGTAVTIGATGDAVFNNVPFGDTGTPYVLYFKQLTSDTTHNIFEGVITVNMTSSTQTEYVQNTLIAEQTFTLTDANYTGLPITSATLEFRQD